jgi:hypothetical protein
MRNLLLFLAAVMVTAASCSRSTPDDHGCIERTVIKLSDPGTNPAQTKTADSLFDVNHIDHHHYRYLVLQADTFKTQYPPYTQYDQKMVGVSQYVNGLRILNSDVYYIFWNGATHYISGKPIQNASLDTVPYLSLRRLRTLFTNELNKPSASVTPGLSDSCYKAEFGYYDLADNQTAPNLVKAWRVTVMFSNLAYPYDGYPVAYFKDNGQLISFSGNIISID